MTYESVLLAIRDELAGIRAVLELIATRDDTPAVDPACTHPAEMVADFGLTNGEPDWVCKACGYRSLTKAVA